MQYGSMYGDMPEGKMFWSFSKKKDCEGYEGYGSYRIEYKVKGKDFSSYSKCTISLGSLFRLNQQT